MLADRSTHSDIAASTPSDATHPAAHHDEGEDAPLLLKRDGGHVGALKAVDDGLAQFDGVGYLLQKEAVLGHAGGAEGGSLFDFAQCMDRLTWYMKS